MGVIPDRPDFVRRLTQTGQYTEAEAIVLLDTLDAALPQPATKLDFMQLRADFLQQMGDLRAEVGKDVAGLRGEFAGLRAEVRKDITDLRAEVVRDFSRHETDIKVLSERVERVADRTLIRGAAVLVVVATALFGALRVWPAGG